MAERGKRVVLEVVNEQIRHQDAARLGMRLVEEITPVPDHPRVQVVRSRREVVGGNVGFGKEAGELSAEPTVTRADFDDAARGGLRKAPHGPADPAFVAHQLVDPVKIPPAAPCLGILRSQMVEEFGDDPSCTHRRRGTAVRPHGGPVRHQANTEVTGFPWSAIWKGLRVGEGKTLSTGRPRAWAMVALKSWTVTGLSLTLLPE